MKKIALLLVIALLITGLTLAIGCIEEDNSVPKTPETTINATPFSQSTIADSAPTPNPIPTTRVALGAPDIVIKVEPSVVAIVTKWQERGFWGTMIDRQAAGTGVIFTADGYILTNNHVVEQTETITVILDDNEEYPATLIGRDSMTDLAVIKINPKTSLAPATFGNSEALRKGDYVLAIGNALALPGGPTVTDGIVSNLGRSIETEGGDILNDLIQTDAAINPGNSGGPLVNVYGEVVGINTAIASEAENIGFAISSATAIPIRDSLVTYGKVVYPFMGVQLDDLTPAKASELNLFVTTGVLIAKVVEGYPADKAGLKANDVIIAFDGKPVTLLNEVRKLIRQHRVGDTVNITFVRGTDTLTANVALVETPSE